MAYQTIPPSAGESATLGADAATFDCPVSSGDGLYVVELQATTSGSFVTCTLRVNGAALTSPKGLVWSGKDTDAAPLTLGGGAYTNGTIFGTAGSYNPTSFRVVGTIGVRSGVVCTYNLEALGFDASRTQLTIAAGRHTPGAPLSSIGFAIDGSFVAGSVLRVTKSGA